MSETMTPDQVKAKLTERIGIANQAIKLEEPKRIPIWMTLGSVVYNMAGSSVRESAYDFDKATDAVLRFYNEYQPDTFAHDPYFSGNACDTVQVQSFEWPGKKNGKLDDHAEFQIRDVLCMEEDEYEEAAKDWTGFMIRKYYPRLYPPLKAFENIHIVPVKGFGNVRALAPLLTPEVTSALETVVKAGKEQQEANAAYQKSVQLLMQNGFPPMCIGSLEAPFDIIADYMRGTVNTLTDMYEYEDEMLELMDQIADMEIDLVKRTKKLPIPVNRMFIPMTAGADSMMANKQYEKFYWKPLQKIVQACCDCDFDVIMFTEGKYNSRLEMLRDVPKGRVLYHFQNVDMKNAKKVLGDTACISGGYNVQLLERGTKKQVIDEAKELIETCAPGGGYIFDFDACLEGADPEKLHALMDTIHSYDRT